MSTTVKISQLPSALSGDITTNSDVLPIIDGDTTKQITVENLLAAAGTAVSGNLIPYTLGSDITSSFDLGSPTAVWQELYVATSSINFVDSGGVITKFTKKDVADLKAGKSIATDSNKKFVNSADDTTYIRMGNTGKAWHYVSGSPILKLGVGNVTVGDSTTTTTFGSAGITGGMSITGSTVASGSSIFTGSFEQSGSTTFTGGGFVVNDLLNLLANYGQTGIPTGSGEGGVSVGDINLDGQVNVTDLLLLLSGMGNPNCIVQNLTIPQNTNYQMIGPEICVSQSIVVTVGNNSYFSIT